MAWANEKVNSFIIIKQFYYCVLISLSLSLPTPFPFVFSQAVFAYNVAAKQLISCIRFEEERYKFADE